MNTLYVAIDNGTAVIRSRNGEWKADLRLVGHHPMCIAVDPFHQEQVYCGTFDDGLWYSPDAGTSGKHVGDGIDHEAVMSLAVSETKQVNGFGVVYAGTQPSA